MPFQEAIGEIFESSDGTVASLTPDWIRRYVDFGELPASAYPLTSPVELRFGERGDILVYHGEVSLDDVVDWIHLQIDDFVDEFVSELLADFLVDREIVFTIGGR